MKQIYQIHNVGVFIDDLDIKWETRILENIKVQLDGFEIYNGLRSVDHKLIIKNMEELDARYDAIVVPGCSYYYPEGIMRSEYSGVAYKDDDRNVIMWTSNETWYIPYLLEMLFVKQGITFVHGASVAVNQDEGKLILAFGGIGKTCFIANAAKKEKVTILGDDLILVSDNGELFSYPRPFCLYEYHKDLFPQYFSMNRVKYVHIEDNMYFKRGIRKLKKMFHIKDNCVYSYLTVSPVQLFPKDKIQISPVRICDVYVMRRNQAIDKVEVSDSNIDYEKAANFGLDVILHEWDVGLKIVLNSYAQNNANIYDYIDLRKRIIRDALKNAKNIKYIDIPEKMSAVDVSSELNKLILKNE